MYDINDLFHLLSLGLLFVSWAMGFAKGGQR